MALIDGLLEQGTTLTVGHPCKVARLADDLGEPHRTAYLRLVNTDRAHGGLPDADTAAKLAAAGISLGATTIRNHRRQVCTCPRLD